MSTAGFCEFLKKYRWIILIFGVVLTAVAIIEFRMGRLPLGPDGKFGFWEGNIWSQEQSQRLADPYSFTHIIHGLLFYALFWILARRATKKYRFIFALLLEASWEILENSPIIIKRYRAETISLGYVGDSVINSLSDILMMSLGFLIASKARIWTSISLFFIIEIGLLFWIRDNLTLNIIMLIHPIKAIKAWQMIGH